MAQAIWHGVVLAESDETLVVEGNHYFPPTALNRQYFTENDTHSVCPWKGTATYYDIAVEGQVNEGAAWSYPDPKEAAKAIKAYVAFWRGVEVVA